jgi:hypothetical protein
MRAHVLPGQFVAFMMLLSGCTPLTPAVLQTPAPAPRTTITTLDNTGSICILKLDPASKELSGYWRAEGGCFSSSCTRIEDQRLSIARGETDLDLRFDAHVKLTESRAPSVPCSADCMGSGYVPFTITNVIVGERYSIWLGSQKRGEFLVPRVFPEQGTRLTCFQ